MTMNDMITLQIERKDLLHLRDVLGMVADMMVADREFRNYQTLDVISHVNRILEEAVSCH